MESALSSSPLIGLTAKIVSAYVSNNAVPTSKLPDLISQVYSSIAAEPPQAVSEAPAKSQKPAVPIGKSVYPDFVVCLEDGKKFKSLKRYLRTQYLMSPEQYRAKWRLPPDYPMVSPNYARARSDLAKTIGLGRRTTSGR